MMDSLTTALYTATAVFLGKIVYDAWIRHQQKISIAGALAGEIGAYIDLLNPAGTSVSYRALASLNREDRVRHLSSISALPNTHPVFEKVADKLGILDYEDAYAVSRFYNVVTGMRLSVTGMSMAGFLDAGDQPQIGRLHFIADVLEAEEPSARALVKRLKDYPETSLLIEMRHGVLRRLAVVGRQ